MICAPKLAMRLRTEVTRPHGCGWAHLVGEITWLFVCVTLGTDCPWQVSVSYLYNGRVGGGSD